MSKLDKIERLILMIEPFKSKGEVFNFTSEDAELNLAEIEIVPHESGKGARIMIKSEIYMPNVRLK